MSIGVSVFLKETLWDFPLLRPPNYAAKKSSCHTAQIASYKPCPC